MSKKYEHKTKKTTQSVTAFLNAVEHEGRRKDAKTVLKLMKELTKKKPAMWGASIVGFDQYTFEGKSGISGVWPMIGFSPRKTALTIYIMPGLEKYDALLKKLGPYKMGKSCLYIKSLDDVHLPTLKKIMAESYKHMKKHYS